jgi:hypothetical protein
MKLRIHYEYKFKVRTKDFVGTNVEIEKFADLVAVQRPINKDGLVTFTSDFCKGFSLPARSIVLMEVID